MGIATGNPGKKNSEVGQIVPVAPGVQAAPVNRAVASSPDSRVTSSVGFGLGDPAVTSKPTNQEKVQWDVASAVKVVDGVADSRKGNPAAMVLSVFKVQDGDGIVFKGVDGKPNLTCRLDGIDARETPKPFLTPPRPGQPYGAEALSTLKNLVEGKQVTVTVTQPLDKYGRAVCQIDVAGKDVNSEMIRVGAAWLYEKFVARGQPLEPDTPVVAARRILQTAAIAGKVGMHASAPSDMPGDYRKGTDMASAKYKAANYKQ